MSAIQERKWKMKLIEHLIYNYCEIFKKSQTWSIKTPSLIIILDVFKLESTDILNSIQLQNKRIMMNKINFLTMILSKNKKNLDHALFWTKKFFLHFFEIPSKFNGIIGWLPINSEFWFIIEKYLIDITFITCLHVSHGCFLFLSPYVSQ